MIAAIMQPTYLPWMGYFKLINSVEKFVFLDDVQINKRSWQQRNKILFNSKEHYLTVPIKTKGKYFQNIKDVVIDNSSDWRNNHLKTINLAYKNKKYFDEIYEILRSVYDKKYNFLCSFNIDLIKSIMRYLEIESETISSSNLMTEGNKEKKLISILKKINASKYIAPVGSRDYIGDGKIFIKSQIELEYFNFDHPKYPQGNMQKFVDHLSVIDALFNVGKNTLKLIN